MFPGYDPRFQYAVRRALGVVATALAFLGHRPGAFPVAERAATEVLALPIHPSLAPEQVEAVTACVAKYFESP